jgi:hypothetical protein
MESYNVLVSSAHRLSGTVNDFVVKLPVLPKGPYKCTVQGTLTFNASTAVYLLQTRGDYLARNYDTSASSGWSSCLSCVTLVPTRPNVIYFSNAPSTLEFRFVTAVDPNAVATTAFENCFHMNFEPIDNKTCKC